MIYLLSQKRKEREDCFNMNTDNQPKKWVKSFIKEWEDVTKKLKCSGYDLSKVVLAPVSDSEESWRHKNGTFRPYEKDITE